MNVVFVILLFIASCGDSGTNPNPGLTDEQGRIATIAGTGIAGYDGDGGDATQAQLNTPVDVVVRPWGDIIVVDLGNHRVRSIAATMGGITTIAGTGERQGSGALNRPSDIAFAADGYFVVSWADHVVFRYAQDGTREAVVGTGEPGCAGGAAAGPAVTSWPRSVGIAGDGSVLFAEQGCLRIRALSPEGELTTYAGTAWSAGYGGDDGPASEAIFGGPYGDDSRVVPPFGFALSPEDPPDEHYIADTANNVIREINLFNGRITTFAGTGEAGFDNGSPEAATFNRPSAVFVSEDHTVWVVDTGNHVIRSIDPLQTEVTTAVGTGEPGYNGDGIAALDAQLNSPGGVYVTNDGMLYIADSGNHRIRQVQLPGFQHGSHDHDHE